MKQTLLAFAGAAIGGVVGYLAFFWLRGQGLYGMILPGGLLGLGAGIGRTRSAGVAIAFSVAALLLGLFTEWRHMPHKDDPSFGYFLKHVGDLQPVTLVMIAVGAAIAFWVPFRRKE